MKFGVREIVDVVFKATEDGQRIGTKTFKKYQPVFMIDTATTSSLEQATTTVYAQGGKGYARLIAWEGEKTMTFTVTDALMSPMGLAVLTGAGLINPGKDGAEQAHFHLTINGRVKNTDGEVDIKFADIRDELGLGDMKAIDVCNTIEMYGTKLDGSGAGTDWYNNVTIKNASGDYTTVEENGVITFIVKNDDVKAPKDATVQIDFYVVMNNSLTEIVIEPSSFGGYFYVEAQTLFRAEATGKDMAAEIIIPKAKVQSAFTFTMAASGDPSTFDFVMDAMPGYTRFDATKKVMCKMQIVGVDSDATEASAHSHETEDENLSPSFQKPDAPVIDISDSTKVGINHIPAGFAHAAEYQDNQNDAIITVLDNNIQVSVTEVDDLYKWLSTDPGQQDAPHAWIALDIDTGENSIIGINYGNYTLQQSDVDEASAWGVPEGHIILWLKAEEVILEPKTFTLSKGSTSVNVTINVVERGNG